MSQLKTLDDIDVTHKRVLLRIDINSDIRKNKPVLSDRITAPIKTIKELVRKKAKVVIIAHQGRPGSYDFTSLKEHAKLINKYIKIKFVADTIGLEAIKEIAKLKDGEILLLENIRFLNEEFKPSTNNKIVTQLAPLFNYYINDAFSASHREQTSIVSFPKVLPSVIGRVFQSELEHVQKIKLKNPLLILGGAKPADDLILIENLKSRVLPTGLLAPLYAISKGYNLGKQNKIMEKDTSLIPKLRKNSNKIVMPIDLAVSKNGKRLDLNMDEFPSNYPVLDIGKKTIAMYVKEIKKAKVIFFKGLAGFCEPESFAIGTRVLLKEIEKSKAYKVVNGGHTIAAVDRYKINKNKINYLTMTGGALIHYLANKSLPGIEALKESK